MLLCNDELVLYNWEEEVRQVWNNKASKTSAKRFTKVKEVCPGSGGSIYLRHRPFAYYLHNAPLKGLCGARRDGLLAMQRAS